MNSSSVSRNPGPGGWVLIALAASFLLVMVGLPVITTFSMAFRDGWVGFWKPLGHRHLLSSLGLSLLVTAVAVPLNAAAGVAAAWLLARFRFPGRKALITLLDLPLSVSPIIVGLLFILLFGKHSFLGATLEEWGFQVIFAPPGLFLVTLFLTIPYVVKEVLPTLQEVGTEEEQAALTLGARGWTTFRRVTLPNIRWSLLYGVLLAQAKALGEYGAASVVSGLIRGKTATLPIHVEILYNEYQTTAAFAAGTLFVFFALVTLGVKRLLALKIRRDREGAGTLPLKEIAT